MPEVMNMSLEALDRQREALKRQQEIESATEMRRACEGLSSVAIPGNMKEAAAVILQLRSQLASSRKMVDDTNTTLVRQETMMAEEIRAVLKDQPERTEPASFNVVRACIERLASEAASAGKLNAVAVDRVKATFIDAGFREMPGLAGYFSAPTPLLACAEASAVQLHGDRITKERYLRSRGWKLANLAWRDPRDGSLIQFDAAITMQFRRDILPLKGLAGRDWTPIQSPEPLRGLIGAADDELDEQSQEAGE